MVNYLGELEDDDLVMFSVEHLKDHKGPTKLVEGLEPVCPIHLLDYNFRLVLHPRSWRKRPSSLSSLFGDKLSSRAWPTARVFIPNACWLTEVTGVGLTNGAGALHFGTRFDLDGRVFVALHDDEVVVWPSHDQR